MWSQENPSKHFRLENLKLRICQWNSVRLISSALVCLPLTTNIQRRKQSCSLKNEINKKIQQLAEK